TVQPGAPSSASTPGVTAPKRGPKPKAPMKKHFPKDGLASQIIALVQLAMRQTMHLGGVAMLKAINAVVLHEQDHREASVDDRARFHSKCSAETMCSYYQWVHVKKKSPERYVYNRCNANKVLEDGVLHLDIFNEYPAARKSLEDMFAKLVPVEALDQMDATVTQNQSESLHAKIWQMCLKDKTHNFARVQFCVYYLMMIHNFGIVKGSLNNYLGRMTDHMKSTLIYRQDESLRKLQYEWLPCLGGHHKKRAKARREEREEAFRRRAKAPTLATGGYAPGGGDGLDQPLPALDQPLPALGEEGDQDMQPLPDLGEGGGQEVSSTSVGPAPPTPPQG
ncbi:unnamed protein product, partial [Meganyctiphanes norvegica]